LAFGVPFMEINKSDLPDELFIMAGSKQTYQAELDSANLDGVDWRAVSDKESGDKTSILLINFDYDYSLNNGLVELRNAKDGHMLDATWYFRGIPEIQFEEDSNEENIVK
jgi:hypothetical protein